MGRLLQVLVAVALAVVIYFFSGLPEKTATGLAILALVAVLWITEAFHITITALLVPVLAVSTGALSVKTALSSFSNPTIYLFLGGFALASALRKNQIDKWLAIKVVQLARGQILGAVCLLFLTTAFISMWISNTATAAMILPVALGLLGGMDPEKDQHTMAFVLLGVAYSANIGGLGTIVGSPPNAIAASELGISFAEWMRFGIPLVLLLFPLLILALWLVLRPRFKGNSLDIEHFHKTWDRQTLGVLVIFLVTVSCWLFSKQLSGLLGVERDFDTLVALGAIVALGVTRLLDWKEIERGTEWGVLLLFGGGITLSVLLSESGASKFLADQLLEIFGGMSPLLFLGIAVCFMIFLTELASNTASAALLVPIFYSLPEETIGMPPALLVMGVALAASCAFMLPVATPPNAIVFGSGHIRQRQMMRAGLVLNLLCVVVVTMAVKVLF
jgi:sodium-dependent dicarboxylate transporter 2/3/5